MTLDWLDLAVFMVDCRTCESLQPVDTVAVEGGGQHRCATCGTAFGWWATGTSPVIAADTVVGDVDATAQVEWDRPWR